MIAFKFNHYLYIGSEGENVEVVTSSSASDSSSSRKKGKKIKKKKVKNRTIKVTKTVKGEISLGYNRFIEH